MESLWKNHKEWLKKYNGSLNIPKAGEVWYIRLPKAITCTQVVIQDVTNKTITVFSNEIESKYLSTYVRSEIEFIERVENDTQG